MKNIIVYHPWGTGGNLVKNIISIDPAFEFSNRDSYAQEFYTEEDRYRFFLDYYAEDVTGETWLTRDWDIRKKLFNRHYIGNAITRWNPYARTVYECHGEQTELDHLLTNPALNHFDRSAIDNGSDVERISNWRLLDCIHVFLLPKDHRMISNVYFSKNPTLNQCSQEVPVEMRFKQISIINKIRAVRLDDFYQSLLEDGRTAYKYTADDLFSKNGPDLIAQILQDTGVKNLDPHIKRLHGLWLAQTKDIYFKHFNKELI